ncbi:methionine synthase I [Thioclava sp. SK-1]|uniref:holin family protein n=1 Tax=Thioclava sp. SK-1 TaxID=1889770 RepID=UPI0008266915|nr:holin family protein [Thioclava sp. SK-1]OCX66003.1 methionine synthase I [Thioclava sp. SK-1]
MGLISRVIGTPAATSALGQAAVGVAETFVPNATKKMQAAHQAYIAALDEYGVEFANPRDGWFDRFVNGLNRLPRPMLALGTLGLFIYAMIDPVAFAQRMIGLNHVPEPLWWLLGAIVGFYFGAREAYHYRARRPAGTGEIAAPPPVAQDPVNDNPALREWQGH